MTTRRKAQQIAASLDDKVYSEAFVDAEIATAIPFQIRAMRKERQWTQKDLARETNQHQKTISDFENPDIGPQRIDSLKRIAAAFDVGLVVRFAPFSELVDWSANVSEKSHFVPSRTKDTRLRAQKSGKPTAATTSTFVQTRFDFAESSTTSKVATMSDWKAARTAKRENTPQTVIARSGSEACELKERHG